MIERTLDVPTADGEMRILVYHPEHGPPSSSTRRTRPGSAACTERYDRPGSALHRERVHALLRRRPPQVPRDSAAGRTADGHPTGAR